MGPKIRTTNMRPRSFEAVHFSVYPSFLYVGFEPASSNWGIMRSSMKTSRIKLLMTFAPTGAYVRDQSTTPEVVKTSNVSNMVIVLDMWRAASAGAPECLVAGGEGTGNDEGELSFGQIVRDFARQLQPSQIQQHAVHSPNSTTPQILHVLPASLGLQHIRLELGKTHSPKCSGQRTTTRRPHIHHHVRASPLKKDRTICQPASSNTLLTSLNHD